MRGRLFLLGSALLLPFLVSCGGSGGSAGLSGVMNVASFVIPAGETRTVTGDLIVNSVADLVIEGELKVTPGARVALYSEGDIKIHGPISAAPARGRITRQTEAPSPDLVFAGTDVEITEVVEAAEAGGDIYITTLAETGTITISQNITTKPGRDANAYTEPGGEAGGIHLGNEHAIGAAKKDGKANATKPRSITVTATLTTGRGGHGFIDHLGHLNENLLITTCGPGGGGGNVFLDSNQEAAPTIPHERVVLGRGGDGGSCGSAEEPVRGRSGTYEGEAGQSVQVFLFPEGRGGGLYLRGTFADYSAERGNAGNVFVAAGNGGPGGKGGDTDILLLVDLEIGNKASELHLKDGGNGGLPLSRRKKGGEVATLPLRWEVAR